MRGDDPVELGKRVVKVGDEENAHGALRSNGEGLELLSGIDCHRHATVARRAFRSAEHGDRRRRPTTLVTLSLRAVGTTGPCGARESLSYGPRRRPMPLPTRGRLRQVGDGYSISLAMGRSLLDVTTQGSGALCCLAAIFGWLGLDPSLTEFGGRAGRAIWDAFSDNIGAVPIAVVPFAALVGRVAGVLVVANLLAVAPALMERRSKPRDLMRAP